MNKVEDIRRNAEKAMKAGNDAEAFFHWTHLLHLRPDDCEALAQRSKCFLNQDQHHLALKAGIDYYGCI